MPAAQTQIERFGRTAPFYEKHHEIISRMYAPVTQALIEAAEVGPGHVVLDVATGHGDPALRVAAAVGPEGKVFGVDPVPDMIAAARRSAARFRVGNAQFEVASADSLPFADGAFDAVVSRFGVMFFPSPVDALREILRVLKPGRTVALAVWHFAENSPYHHVLSQVVARYVPAVPPAPDALEPHRFATSGKLCGVLREAGVLHPSERLLRFTAEAPLTVEEFWTLRYDMSIREKVGVLSAEQLADLKQDAIEALREYAMDHGVGLPAEVLIVTGRK